MSSEPIERRVSYIGDRLRSSRCSVCGGIYFKPRNYCGSCGRASIGRMEEFSLFFEKGELETCTIVREPTNSFRKLESFIYGIVSFHNGKIRIPARLTDYIVPKDNIEVSMFEGREITPRFRRRYSVGPDEIIPTASLTFTFTDEYYPYQRYEIIKPSKLYENPGIVGYGFYTSRFRIKEGNMVRAVPFLDEDSITAAVEAAKWALIHSAVDNSLIGKVYVGTESNPYAVKPIASKVIQVLDLGEKLSNGVQGIDAIDTEFACKAATSMIKDAVSLVSYEKSGIQFTMVIGADNSQSFPRDSPSGELDFFIGFGAVAFIIGKYDVIAEVEGWYSVTSDTADFWRRDGQRYPSHGGRFTGEPAYFKHIVKAASKIMEKMNLKPHDIQYFVCHQPNIPFPIRVARILGFKEDQYLPGLQVGRFGNIYAGSSPLGLAAVFDVAKPYERILLVSYGSGAGSDAYVFITTPQIMDKRSRIERFNVRYQAENKFLQYVNYDTYRKFKEGI